MGGTQGLDVTFRRSREIGTGKQSTDTAVDSDALSRERFTLVTWSGSRPFRAQAFPWIHGANNVALEAHVSLASLF